MLVYKVVWPQDHLVSVCAWGKYEVIYPPGELITHPNLFIFPRLADARWFMTPALQLWRAETPVVRPAPARVLASSSLETYGLTFWLLGAARVSASLLVPPAYGSALCDELKLLERVA